MSPRVPITHLNSYHPRADPLFPTPHVHFSIKDALVPVPTETTGLQCGRGSAPSNAVFLFPFLFNLRCSPLLLSKY